MLRSARRATLAVMVLASLLAAGCGTDTSERNAYVDGVNAAQARFATTVTRVATAITPRSTPSQDRKALMRFEGAVTRILADLRRIDVPAQVRGEHARLLSAISGFGADVEEANEALRRPSRRSLLEAQRRIGRATATVNVRISSVITAINKKLESK